MSTATEHEMQLRMLGNSWVYVTCKCLEARRTGWRGKTTNNRGHRRRAPEWRSLGDFPVGTEAQQLRAAYDKHLEEQ